MTKGTFLWGVFFLALTNLMQICYAGPFTCFTLTDDLLLLVLYAVSWWGLIILTVHFFFNLFFKK